MGNWFNEGQRKRAFILADGQAVQFDTVVMELHRSESVITDNPVETGVVISDHMYRQPRTLSIDVAVSDVRLVDEGEDRFESEAGRAAAAWDFLEKLKDAAEPFKYQSGLKLYDNMVIGAISAEQNKQSAAVLFARVDLREVIRSTTDIVTFPPRKKGKAKRQASQPKAQGEKKTEEPSKTTPAKRISILKSILSSDGDVDPKVLAGAL